MSRSSTKLQRWSARYLPAVILFAAFIVLWQVAVSVFDIREYLLPSPWAVLQAMTLDEIQWLDHAWVTALEIFGAFVLGTLCITPSRMCLHMRAGCGSIPAHAAI